MSERASKRVSEVYSECVAAVARIYLSADARIRRATAVQRINENGKIIVVNCNKRARRQLKATIQFMLKFCYIFFYYVAFRHIHTYIRTFIAPYAVVITFCCRFGLVDSFYFIFFECGCLCCALY